VLGGPLVVVTYLLATYAIIYWFLPGRLSADLNIYVAQPLMWGGLALLSYLLWRNLEDRPALSLGFLALAILAGVFQLSILVSAGLVFGFGYSPYAAQAMNMAKNGLYVVTFLAGVEMSRAYLVHRWSGVNTLIVIAAVALLLGVVGIPPAHYREMDETGRAFQTAGTSFLPTASEGVMATLLAFVGGPLPAFTYRLLLHAFEWFSPILPDLEWTVAAFVGTLSPILATVIVLGVQFGGHSEEKPAERGWDVSPLWMLTAIVVVGVIWLNAGLLGVQPALVSGGSMEPTLHLGDVVFTRQVDADTIAVGDVVRFTDGQAAMLHRVVEVYHGPEGSYFVTRGDNNNVEDQPILATQIEGKVVFTLPKVGWVPIYVNKLINRFR